MCKIPLFLAVFTKKVNYFTTYTITNYKRLVNKKLSKIATYLYDFDKNMPTKLGEMNKIRLKCIKKIGINKKNLG